MDAFVMVAAFWVSCSPAWHGALGADSRQTSEAAEAVRRLSAEFETTQRSALDLAAKAKTEAERKAAARAMPDRRRYAQRFLELAGERIDEAAAADALVWIVRKGFRTPEALTAVEKIADHHVRSDRIAGICRALGAQGPQGERLLERIFEENPNPGIRGRACLGLAFARSLRLRQETRTLEKLPPDRPESAEARLHALELRKVRAAVLATEIEHWLRQVLDEFPGILLEQDIIDVLPTGNLGPTASEILRRIAETHPDSATRWEAECGLAGQQMEIASLVAELRSVAALPPDSKQCAGPGLAAACVFGGERRLSAVDSKVLVREIEQRLERIADRVNDVSNPGTFYFHLIMDIPTLSQYHAGTEALLRCAAAGHPSSRIRAGARRSLALYLAGLADLCRTIDSDRALWVNRLGEDRFAQIRRLNADRLMHESLALADEISRENQEAGKTPDARIEELWKTNKGRDGDTGRPDRVTQPLK